MNLDDRLRSVPGFSLFRRNSSLVAHPTTQGVSLRGVGPTGASRTLVLWDSIPLNDPFGGWVYWTRIDPDELSRVEISRGASTSVFGDRALGGAIGLFSREPEPRRIHARFEAGNRNTEEAAVGGSHLWSRFAASAHARAFNTDGYFIVPVRGAVDREANVRFVAGDTRLDWLGAADRVFLKLDILAEDRGNGTSLQRNSTSLGDLAARYVHEGSRDSISVEGFHTREMFRSSFSEIALDRNTERLTLLQTVPAEAVGGALVWQRHQAGWNLLGGADVYRVEGFSHERIQPAGARVGGGTQLQHGVFGQFDVTAGRVKFFIGAREHVTGSQGTFFAPSAGWTAGFHRLRARASVYRGFRAPTLNEMFRQFRAGNVVTQANPALKPETLFGAEAGVDVIGESHRASVTFFRNSLDDLITNVTLSVTPALVTRERRNAASALSRGAEVSVYQNWRGWRGELAYLYADSRMTTGELLAQVPRHHATAMLTYARAGTLASFGLRGFSSQFDDDRNTLLLPGFAVLQAFVRQRIAGGLSALAAMENLLDRRYLTGASPPTIGAPRLWRAGLRWDGRL